MGKGIKAGKKKKTANVTMPVHMLEKLYQEGQDIGIERAMILATPFIAEEYHLNDEQILEMWDAMSRWSEALDKNIIHIERVIEIINNMTGLNLHWDHVGRKI